MTLERTAIGPGGDSARVSLYTPAPGSGIWGQSTWDGSIWSSAGWQYVDCEVLEVVYRWGAGTEAGVLTKAEAGELDLELWDPLRLLDPLNVSSELWGALRPGTPVRLEGVISDDGTQLWPAAYGFIDSTEHDLATGTGRIRAVDGVSLLGLATFPPGNQPVANTLRARVRDIVSRAGMAGLVPCQPESDFAGIADPPVTPRDPLKGSEAVWPMILEAAEDALWYVWVDPTGTLRFLDMSSFLPPALGLGCSPGGAQPINWLVGLADVVGRVAGDRITNRVTAEDSAGAPLGPWDDAVSVTLYGPRALDAARAVPSASSWAAEILTDRADASYQLDVLEVRPYNRVELYELLRANTDGPRELVVRDDEHGPVLELIVRYYGGELGVSSEGWRAVWVTGLRPGQLPSREELD